MAIEISTLSIKVQSNGVAKAADDLNKIATTGDKAEASVNRLTASIAKLTQGYTSGIAAVNAYMTAQKSQQQLITGNSSAMSLLGGTIKTLSDSITRLDATIAGMNANMQTNTRVVNVNRQAIQQHTVSMADAQAAARGLAGSMGALWVTYGSMIPLAAGLAIGSSLKQIVTVGAEVENSLEAIRLKGDVTIEDMGKMQAAIADISQGIYGPQEVTKAFETLTLAGLSAKQSINAIGAALNLATAGGTSIESAAESLVTIGTAVGATASEYDYLADGITKAANISLASVDSIAQAVKRASVVNKLYGASFEDILTQTAALAQLGIKNTAAGTAITNFYSNSLGTSQKAKKALDQLGMSFTDATGKAKPLVEAFEEFTTKLNKFDLKSQQNIITDIFGERALRDVEGLRDMVNSAADAQGTYANKLRETQGLVQGAAGTAALIAAQQALTTENKFKSMANTLTKTFTGVFASIEPALASIADKMKEAFGSQQFATALTAIASGFVSVVTTLIDFSTQIGYAVEAFLLFKAVSLGADFFIMMQKGLTGVALAFQLVTTAEVAATSGATAMSIALRAIPGIGIALTGISAAFALMALHSKPAAKSTQDLADSSQKLADTYNTDFIKALDDEVDRLKKVNKALDDGLTKTDALTRATKEAALEKQKKVNIDAIDAAQANLDSAKKTYTGAAITSYTFDKTGSKEALAVTAATKQLNDAKKKSADFDATAAARAQEIIDLTQRQSDKLKQQEQEKDAAAKKAAGTQTYSSGEDKGAKKQANFLAEELSELDKLTAGYNARSTAMLSSYESGKKVMADTQQAIVEVNEALHKYGSEKAYQQALDAAIKADKAKDNNEAVKQFTELGSKMREIIQGEEAYKDAVANGSKSNMGNLERQAEAMIKLLGVGSQMADNYREQAKAADLINKSNEARTKAESYTSSSLVRAGSAKDDYEAMVKYGTSAKQTASDLAELEIVKLNLNESTDAATIADRRHAAALETQYTAMKNLQKMVLELGKVEDKVAAASLEGVIGSETAKVAYVLQSTKKQINAYADAARAAVATDLSSGKTNSVDAAAALSQIDSVAAKATALSNTKFKLDFDVAKLDDISTMFDSLSEAADTFGDSFAHVGTALTGLSKTFKKFGDQQEKINKGEKVSLGDRIGAYGDMADASKSFFEEGSAGYKTLDGVAKVVHAAQIAMNLVEMAQLATKAVLTQAQGDPYTAWARMAAMAAAVAALGFAVGGGFSGGGGGGQTAEQVQATQGTGTVLGDSAAKSESITKSIELLSDNSDLMLPINQQMLSALNAIKDSMTGLSSLIAQTSGITDGTSMGIKTGTLSTTTGNALTDAIHGVVSKIPLVADVLGGVLNKIGSLWGKTSQKIVDSGIQFGGSVDALQNGQGYDQYASVDTTKSSFFGLSKSTSNSVQTSGLNSELSNQFGLIFTNLETALVTAAPALGQSAATVGTTIGNTVIQSTKISLKDLKGDELTDAINNVLSATMDQIARAALPGLDAFQQVGEGYAQTVVRVSSGVETAGYYLDQLGIKAINYTTIANKQGDVGAEIARQSILMRSNLSGVAEIMSNMSGTAEELTTMYRSLLDIQQQMVSTGVDTSGLGYSLINGAGGTDKLSDALASFQENYFTEAEQAAAKTAAVANEFARLGIAMPASMEGLKNLIQSTGTSTDETAKLTGQLLILSDAFADAKSAAVDLVSSAQSDVASAYTTASNALQKTIDGLKSFQTTLLNFIKSLNTGTLSTLTPLQKEAATKATYEETLAKARAGDEDAKSALTAAAQAYLEASQVVNSSSDAYTIANLQVQADLNNLAAASGEQQTAAQKELDALTQQVTGLIELNATAIGIQDAITALGAAMVAAGLTTQTEFDALHGSHAGGLESVPFDGYRAELHAGEAVVDAQAMSAMRRYFGASVSNSNSGASAEMVAEMRALREEVSSLRADQAQQTAALVAANYDATDAAASKTVAGTAAATKAAARTSALKSTGSI